MTMNTRGAAVSHVGRVRTQNQDSGYSGESLFLVADGMGGHAGGDVASAIATNFIKQVDGDYPDAEAARDALRTALLDANRRLIDTVRQHPELTGMGTTVSAILRVGDHVALAHIGDSRIYLYRDGELTQISTDHTFVQRLVETGRITEEEALVHPRRSVLMRVLGDVDANPEIDAWVLPTLPGDRWLICSDGLSGFVKNDQILRAFALELSPKATADRLLRYSLDAGAPDNVTAIIADIDRDVQPHEPVTVGAAAAPISYDVPAPRTRSAWRPIPATILHPSRSVAEPTHFEPKTDDYLSELIDEGARRLRRRRIALAVVIAVVIAAIVGAAWGGYAWTQTRYYVGVAPDGNVAIYEGVQQSLGTWQLSHVYQESAISVTTLNFYQQQQVRQTINAASFADAVRIVEGLRRGD